MVVDAVAQERFLLVTDDIAQTWIDFQTSGLERWLKGLRRLQARIERDMKAG